MFANTQHKCCSNGTPSASEDTRSGLYMRVGNTHSKLRTKVFFFVLNILFGLLEGKGKRPRNDVFARKPKKVLENIVTHRIFASFLRDLEFRHNMILAY